MHIFKTDNSPSLIQHFRAMHETPRAVINILLAWLAAAFATAADKIMGLQLAQWVQLVMLLFTVCQTFFLLRDKWWRERKQRRSNRRAQYDRSKRSNTQS